MIILVKPKAAGHLKAAIGKADAGRDLARQGEAFVDKAIVEDSSLASNSDVTTAKANLHTAAVLLEDASNRLKAVLAPVE